MFYITESRLGSIIRKTINEVLSSKEDTFNNWKSIFDNYLNEIISECTDIYLDKMGLKVRIDIDYNFGGKHWLAAYEGSSDDLSRGVITIAVNYSRLYEEMRKRGIDNDDFNIEAQAKITVGHEIGHGIVDYLVNYYDGENEAIEEFVHDYNDGDFDEEEIAEEFGESMFPEATGRWSSYLGRIINKI